MRTGRPNTLGERKDRPQGERRVRLLTPLLLNGASALKFDLVSI